MACNKYYLISYSCTILQYKNFNFSYSWALYNYMQKWPVFMRNIMQNHHDLNFVFMRNFVQKKIIYFEWMRNFVQNWFRIDTKMMRNFVQKKSFRAKPRNCCARESTVSWKPLRGSSINLDIHHSKVFSSELKTLKWWISRLMLNLLFFLISRLI
mgnify:CR=1 FL=1